MKSAFELLCNEEQANTFISTSCQSLNENLGGGIPLGSIMEFCGEPGSGKTQLCLQICVNVQVPEDFEGPTGKAVFIDTNFGFHPNRLKNIATGLVTQLQSQRKSLPDSFTVERIMQNILYAHIDDVTELFQKINHIENFVTIKRPQENVKLIVIDSFSFLLRTSIEDSLKRVHLMGMLLTRLSNLIQSQNIALVLTNDLTTKINGNESKLWPSLGHHYGQRMNQRILLKRNREKGYFEALPFKTFCTKPKHVKFIVMKEGIQDFHENKPA